MADVRQLTYRPQTLHTSDSAEDKGSGVRQPPRRRGRGARILRRALAGLILVVLALLVALALRPEAIVVDTTSVARGTLTNDIQETGATRVKDRFVVSAPVTGTLSRITLEAGDAVRTGDVLAEIAPAQSPLLDERARAQAEARLSAAHSTLGQAKAQRARADNALSLAQHELERSRALYEGNGATLQELERAQFQARMRRDEVNSAEFGEKVAQEEVRSARAVLDGTGPGRAKQSHVDVLAPISGVILRVHRESSGVVQAGAPLLEVGDPHAWEVVVDLLTTDAVHVQPGMPVVLTGWGGDHDFAGKVRRVEPSGFTRLSALGVDEQRVNVLIVDADPNRHSAPLADGYHVEARIVLWEEKNVLQVPQGAAFRRGDGWAVYRVEAGRALLTPVEIGQRSDTQVEITKGLAQGAVVVVHPGERVEHGKKVEAR